MKDKRNRFYKDTVFVDLFSEDEKGKENFLSLYNALFNTKLKDTSKLKNIRLDQVMYKSYRNDISFLVEDKIIVFIEHQSTINENMPLRFFQYLGRMYERTIPQRKKYGRKQILIDRPEFFVFYNGKEDYPVHKNLKLSETFKSQKGKNKVELIVEIININKSKNSKLLKKCPKLDEYSQFIEISRKFIEEDSRNGYKNAIKYCIEQDILREYLDRKSREVENMLVGEYSYEDDIEVQRNESKEEGIKEGLKKGIINTAKKLKEEKINISVISKCTGLSKKEIKKL